VVIYTLSNIPGFLFLLFTVLRKKRITLDIDWNLAREFLKYAFPIFLYVVFITIYGNIDILLLQYFSGNYQTGIYAAAARLVGPLLFISNAVTVALYPLLTSMFSESSEKIGKVFRLGFKVLAVAGVGVAIFGCFLSKFIIATLYGGQFQESSTLLVVLFIAQVFAFLSYFFTNVNTAINRQSFNTLVAVCVCVLNLSLNLFFIPRWSAYGAVVVRLATEFGGCVLLWILLLNSIHFERWRDVGKIVLFAALFSGALYLLHGLNVIVFGVLGSMGFLVLLFAVRIFDETEISQLRVALRIGSSQGESRI
jgi:O-antigen/teichoic acid export membrane protein